MKRMVLRSWMAFMIKTPPPAVAFFTRQSVATRPLYPDVQ